MSCSNPLSSMMEAPLPSRYSTAPTMFCFCRYRYLCFQAEAHLVLQRLAVEHEGGGAAAVAVQRRLAERLLHTDGAPDLQLDAPRAVRAQVACDV